MNTYNTKLQNNNTNLSNILDKVNGLPDAGSGSGSAETCAVVITNTNRTTCTIKYTDATHTFITATVAKQNSHTFEILKNTIALVEYTDELTVLSGTIEVIGSMPVTGAEDPDEPGNAASSAFKYGVILITGDGEIRRY